MVYIVWDGHEPVWAGDGREYLRGVGLRYLKHPYFEECLSDSYVIENPLSVIK